MSPARFHPLLVVAAALVALTGGVAAQPLPEDEGPVVVGKPRGKLVPVTVDRFNAALDFRMRYREDKRKTEELGNFTNTELTLIPTLDISTVMFFGHRNLVEYTLDAGIGFQQQFLDIELDPRGEEESTTFLPRIDTSATIFGASAAPTTFYFRRNEAIIERDFTGSINNLLQEYGGFVRLQIPKAPTIIRLFHRENEYNDQLGTLDDRLTQDVLEIQSVWSPNQQNRATLDYDFRKIDERRGGGAFEDDFDRHDLNATHEFLFGQNRQHQLRSQFRFFDESRIVPQTLIRLDEILILRPLERMESRVRLTFEDRSVGDTKRQLFRGSGLVQYKFFESLVTTGEIGGSHTKLREENFTGDQIFGTIDLDYTKRVPYGRVNAEMTVGFDYRDDSELGNTIRIVDQRGAFNDPFPIILNQRFIIPESIVVSALPGFPTYVEGRDYTVRPRVVQTDLFRVVGGQINDGQTVLIDYNIGPQPASTTTSLTFGISGSYLVQEGPLLGLSVSASYRTLVQDLQSDDPLLEASEAEIWRISSDYNRAPFSFGVQYEDQDTTFSPFTRFFAFADWDQDFGGNTRLSLRYSHDHIEFLDDDDTTDLDRILAEMRYDLTRGLDIRLRLEFRDERNTRRSDVRGFQQVFEVNWSRRQTSIYASISNSILETDLEETLSTAFAFGFRREF